MFATASSSPARYYSSAPSNISSRQDTFITQTYSLAHTARRKLAREASRADLHLGRLVGHANLLDSLMLELSRAERERHLESQRQQQQMRFYERNTVPSSCSSRHVQWVDRVVEKAEEDWEVSDADSTESDSDYDSDESEEMEADMVSLQRVPSHRLESYMLPPPTPSPSPSSSKILSQPPSVPKVSLTIPQKSEDCQEDLEILQLEYTSSHSSSFPPELDDDSDSSDEELMPPSPPADIRPKFFPKSSSKTPYSQIGSAQCVIPSSEAEEALFNKEYYIPPSSSTTTELIPTINLY